MNKSLNQLPKKSEKKTSASQAAVARRNRFGGGHGVPGQASPDEICRGHDRRSAEESSLLMILIWIDMDWYVFFVENDGLFWFISEN